MTRGIEEALNLPALEDALKASGLHPKQQTQAQAAQESDPPPEESEPEIDQEDLDAYEAEAAEEIEASAQEKIREAQRRIRRMREAAGEDHERSMDDLHKEGLQHARDLMDLAYNIDHARSRGIFEQAANFYKIALDSKNTKRDMQLKAMRLALDQRKLELEERKLLGAEEQAENTPVQPGAVLVEDRNELLRRWKAQRAKD
jgi:hypothetical protein